MHNIKPVNRSKVNVVIENIHREDLSDSETWNFIKKIGKEKGWGIGTKLNIKVASDFLKMPQWKIKTLKESFEHTTPEVKKALKEGKIALDTASEISRAEPEIQKQIALEALSREGGLRRDEVRQLIKEPTPDPIKYEVTIDNIGSEVLSTFHNFKHSADNFMKVLDKNEDTLSKSMLNQLTTTAGLHLKSYLNLVRKLKEKGGKPNPLILALMKANGQI